MDDDLKRVLEEMTAETRRDTAETRREFKLLQGQFEAFANGIRQDFKDLRNYFDIVLERSDSKFALISEGLKNLQESGSRQVGALRDETKQETEETRAMMKFSHSGLDRRLTSVESDVKKLKAKR